MKSLTVDIGAARSLGVYPMPVTGPQNKTRYRGDLWTH